MTNTYHVTAKRWEKGWELHIDGVGVTQAHRFSEAELMVRDLIARREETLPARVDLVWDLRVS